MRMGTTSQASPAQAGCSKLCEEFHGPSAAGKDALFKQIKTLHLQTQGFNETIAKFSFNISCDFFEPHVSRDWDPLLNPHSAQVRHLKKKKKKITFTS